MKDETDKNDKFNELQGSYIEELNAMSNSMQEMQM